MLNKFLSYIRENQLFDPEHKILLGISGGIDSAVMAHLFAKASFHFAMAHCNFKLRGTESDEDQEFVEQLTKQYNVAFFTIGFDTSVYSQKEGVSIQMAARDLRYNWFKKIASEEGYNNIAIAHNRDDIGETILMNLIRGTGLKGLTGIKPVQGQIIRPMLFAGRDQIEEYAIAEKIAYREDTSNSESKYHRNLIRNEIFPLMKKINPSLNETLSIEAEIFRSGFELYKREVDRIREAITLEENERWVLSIPKIQALRISPPVLFELLTPFGFSYSDTVNILNSLQAESGKKFYSAHYVLLKDRNTLLIEKIGTRCDICEYEIPDDTEELFEPIRLTFRHIKMNKDFELPVSNRSVALDADKINFPLKLRQWHEGDFFIPLGMKGRKKLSDFFTDRKINLFEKKKIWLLLSGEDIIWIIGQQIDDRYKISPDIKNVLLVSLKN